MPNQKLFSGTIMLRLSVKARSQSAIVQLNDTFHIFVIYSSELSAMTSSTLTKELESIEQLHGMEPDNKCEYYQGCRLL